MLSRLRTLFLQGIALLAPLIITIALLVWLARIAEVFMGGMLRGLMPADWYVPGMGLLAGIGLTLAAGLLANLFLVRWLLGLAERIVDRIPLVKVLFQGLKDLARFFGQGGERPLGRPVCVELGGQQLVGFVMQERTRLPIVAAPRADAPDAPADAQADATAGGPDATEAPLRIAVYLPMSFQVGGYTLYLDPAQVRDLDVGIDQALRTVLTGGSWPQPGAKTGAGTRVPRRARRRPATPTDPAG